MKIALLVTGKGYSFTSQAHALMTALQGAGEDVRLTLLSDEEGYQPGTDIDLIIPIGAWQDYDEIVQPGLDSGIKTLPWLVADILVDDKPVPIDSGMITKLNTLKRLLTTSEFCKQNFIRSGVKPEIIEVLPECCDEDKWHPYNAEELQAYLDYVSIDEETRTALPEHFNLRRAKAEGIPILFTTGGRATSKGSLEVMQALGRLDKNKKWLYIIKTWPSTMGFTDGVIELQTAAENNISSRLRYFSGEFSDKFLIGLMNACDIYVAPSHSESFGLPLVEAQLCGKMVVTHNATATSETVLDNITGLQAKSHVDMNGEAFADIADLSDKLSLAISDVALRKQLSQNARQSAIERFGRHAIAARCMDIARSFVS